MYFLLSQFCKWCLLDTVDRYIFCSMFSDHVFEHYPKPIFLKIFFLTVSMFVLLKCCKKYFLMTTNVTSTLALYLVVSVYFICQIQHNFSLQHSRIATCLSRCLFYIITLWLVHILVLYLYGSVIEALINILCCFVILITS